MVILGYKLNIIIFPEKVKGEEFGHFTFTFLGLTFGVSGKLQYNKSEL